MRVIYITNPSVEIAKSVAKHLLEKKLIECANIYSNVQTMYIDNGIKEDNECILIAKTKEILFEKVTKEVEKIHPYTTPCILKISAKANKKYDNWLKTQLK